MKTLQTIIEPLNPATSLLRDELEGRGITKARAAAEMGVPRNRLTKICQEDTPISLDTALRLEAYLGIEAHVWLNLQSRHRLAKERKRKGEEIRREVSSAGHG